MEEKRRPSFIVLDPEEEYANLLKAFGGSIIKLTPSSGSYINPIFDIGFGSFDKRLEISEEEILSNKSKILDNPYGDISKLKKELKYCKNPLQKKELEKKLQGALKCKKVNKNKMSSEEILKEKILNEVKTSLKEEKKFLSKEEYITIFYEELKAVVDTYKDVEFNEEDNCLIFKIA